MYLPIPTMGSERKKPAQTIINTAHNTTVPSWLPFEFSKFVNLGDTIIHTKYGKPETAEVTFISRKGVNIRTEYGDRFVKWYHVLGVEKIYPLDYPKRKLNLGKVEE